MKFTEEQLARMRQEAEAREYELYSIRLAAKCNSKFSGDHPENIRREIKRLQRLLVEAGV